MTRATRPGQGIDRASTMVAMVSLDEVCGALERVIDPEIRRPITDLNMVDDVQIEDDGTVMVSILLTTAGCPLRDSISADVKNVVGELEGVERVFVKMGAMNSEQRAELQAKLRGSAADRVVPFAQKGSLTRVLAVTSGKGGVGKSSVTVNLAAAMAASGLKVGLVDADIFGFSVPRMMGVDQPPTALDGMIIPPVAHDVKVISIGMFLPDNSPILWRGPRLHRALEQFFSDVFWGDLDVLLLDLPPGTGDIAISVAQLIPGSEIVVVRSPPRRWPSAPARWQVRRTSAWSASSRTCPTFSCRTDRRTRSSARAAARRSPNSSPRTWATKSPFSAASRSRCRCAKAATKVCPSSWRRAPPRRRRACAQSPAPWHAEPGGSPG